MMAMHRLRSRVRRDFRRLTSRGQLDAATVTLRWNAAAAPADANVAGSYPAADRQTEDLRALVHWVSMRSVQSGNTIFQAGDAIVTFDGCEDLASRAGLTFTLPDGQTYTQANAGREIAEWWDVFVGGEALTKTLLLRLVQ